MEPRLLNPLRFANATLYSLPLPVVGSGSAQLQHLQNPKAANDFLVELQSRNVRRKILSIQQRHRDQQQQQQQQRYEQDHRGGNGKSDSNHGDENCIEMGSSWLAFLAVLCQMHHDGSSFVASPPERLFAAQSVLHRLRRNKLMDAIDLEIESNDIDETMALQLYHNTAFVAPMLDAYQQLVAHWNPFVLDMLQKCFFNNFHADAAKSEEQIKGEVMILTLASVSYITACQAEGTPQRAAILEALGSAIATIALRIRYLNPSAEPMDSTMASHEHHHHPSLVWMISHTFQHVFDRAKAFHFDSLALSTSLAASLSSLPDTILSSSGGARGRLSVDPRSLEAAVTELRTRGFQDLWTALQQIGDLLNNNNNNNGHGIENDSNLHPFLMLATLEKWARFLCVPRAMVDELTSLLASFIRSRNDKERAVALLFFNSVFEGGDWTVEQVLSFGFGLSEHQLIHQAGKRRQSSRSRRKHKELVSNKTTEDSAEQAQQEVIERGRIACRVAVATWSQLNASFRQSLESASEEGGQVDGEGPIGCVATAAQTCLPFILKEGTNAEVPGALELFQELSKAVVQLCCSRNQTVRCLALPPIHAVYRALVSTYQEQPLQTEFVLEILQQCLTRLASSCSYPVDYFVDLRAESSEELEIHRNEIRDLFRALTGGEDEEGTHLPLPSMHLLHRIIMALRDEILQTPQVPPETFVHTLSALAKPLGRLAGEWLRSQDEPSKQCFIQVLEILSTSLQRTTTLFQESASNIQLILPVSRTLNIAVASLAPMLGVLASSPIFQNVLLRILPLATRLSLASLRFLPELATSEDLGYEIRGTMRGPGGEDHVGSLSLMRLTSDSELLTSLVVQAIGLDIKELCAVHEFLKSMEQCRDEISRTHRTTPKSRRILLGVICRLEVSSKGQSGASEMLSSLVHSAVLSVASAETNQLSEQSLFLLCETAHDLATLAPFLSSSFFDGGENKRCLETLRSATVHLYMMPASHDAEVDGSIHQWNRLRGALYSLLVAAANPDLGETISWVARDLIVAECQSVCHFFRSTSGQRGSAIFNDSVISPDVVPSGAFIMGIGKLFCDAPVNRSAPLPHCTYILSQVSSSVIDAILLPVPCSMDGSFCDPRCTIAEAWFLSLANFARCPEVVCSKNDPAVVNKIFIDSVVAAIALIFSPKMGKIECDDNNNATFRGMSMDGPQSLALMDFLSAVLARGPDILGESVEELAREFPVNAGGDNSRSTGLAVLLAALFRAIQGSLPPWVVEFIPLFFSNLFCCGLGKNLTVFGDAMRASMEMRLPVSSPSSMRGVEPGQLLSGYAFDGIQNNTKENFVQQVLDLAEADNHASWKRLKHIVKAACGGKKKDTDFRQKPSLTRWEFDRL
ncbi:hypothetical protein ACA910_019572 [Epithemia clementina (nom. ined.)]